MTRSAGGVNCCPAGVRGVVMLSLRQGTQARHGGVRVGLVVAGFASPLPTPLRFLLEQLPAGTPASVAVVHVGSQRRTGSRRLVRMFMTEEAVAVEERRRSSSEGTAMQAG